MKRFALALSVAALTLGVSAHNAHALNLDIDTVTGTWGSVTGSPTNLSGTGTSQIFFGGCDSPTGCQSSYKFGGIAPQTGIAVGSLFNLGTFTHINNPIDANSSITGATLSLLIGFHTDSPSAGPFSVGASFVFSHNETPNDCNPQPHCADDIVTATTNVGATDVVNIGGTNYTFAFDGFALTPNGPNLTQFSSPEGGSTPVYLDGSFRAVPAPLVGAGLPGLLAACGGLIALARRRRHLVALT